MLTIWWCPCVESSLVLLEEGVCYDQWILLVKLLAFALLHSVPQGETHLLLQGYLDFLLDFQSPIMKRTFFFGVTSRRSYRFFIELFNSSFFGWSIDLDYSDSEWFDLETNRDHSFFLFFFFLKLHPITAIQILVLLVVEYLPANAGDIRKIVLIPG